MAWKLSQLTWEKVIKKRRNENCGKENFTGYMIANSFSHSVDCLLFSWSPVCLFLFVYCAFGVISKKSLPNPISCGRFCPTSFFLSFIELGLTFRFDPFWVNFCAMFQVKVQLYSFIWRFQFFQHYLLKRLSFLHWIVLAKNHWSHIWESVLLGSLFYFIVSVFVFYKFSGHSAWLVGS